MSDGTPSRLNSAAILDVVTMFRTCTVWQALALVSQRPAYAVRFEFYERAMAHAIPTLVKRGLITAYRVTPQSKIHKITNHRQVYAAVEGSHARAASLPPQQARLLLRMREGLEIEERQLIRVGLPGYGKPGAARRVLKEMVEAGVLTTRTVIPDGHMIVLEPTKAGWREYGKTRDEYFQVGKDTPLRTPRGLSLQHHLLAVDAALQIQRETGFQILDYTGDEDLKSDGRRGIDARRRAVRDNERYADGIMKLLRPDGTLLDQPIEMLSTQYSDETMRAKATLPESTRYFVPTRLLVERFQRLTGKPSIYLAADIDPKQWTGVPTEQHPLADGARLAELRHGGRLIDATPAYDR